MSAEEKPKRVLSEDALAKLAVAREKALQVRRQQHAGTLSVLVVIPIFVVVAFRSASAAAHFASASWMASRSVAASDTTFTFSRSLVSTKIKCEGIECEI